MRAVCSLLVLAVISMCVACGPERRCEAVVRPLGDAGNACPLFGVSTPSGPADADEYRAVTQTVGVAPSVVSWFADFTAPPPVAEVARVAGWGADPIITWEPWRAVGDGDYDRESITMADIAAGVHDDYLYWWADEFAASGETVYLRFAHEPNGHWYPWSPAGGTPAETYVAAWRHVHDLFEAKQAHNVRWVWAVNAPYPGSSPIGSLYPGDDYVDLLGLDAYNWGTTQSWSRWREPEELLGSALDEVTRSAPDRRVVITEIASAEAGGSKSQWIRDMVRYLDSRQEVSAFVWFDHDKEADWRLDSTPESAAALAEAVKREHPTR